MSYLGYPRLHFSGGFLADPSTINNTPNNYEDSNDEIKNFELYWNPNGRGEFNLQNCVVTKVVYGPGDETTDAKVDPLIGQTVSLVTAKGVAKIVDLDPDQQNVSELWGMRLQVSGSTPNPASNNNFVSGDYVAGPFNAIWAQALNGPRSSASGAGVYQSQLSNLDWLTNSPDAKTSPLLTLLKNVSADQLSINFVVNSHNNSPVLYAFNPQTFDEMKTGIPVIPDDIIAKLQPMALYVQNTGRTRGDVPTASYVNHQLNVLLGQQDAQKYGDAILAVTLKQSSTHSDSINTAFPTGLINGTIGPQVDESPVFYTPSRTMAPFGNSTCYFAPFNVQSIDNKTRVTVNLGNSLATNKPGYLIDECGYGIAQDALGDLTLGYFDQMNKVISSANFIPFANLPTQRAELAALMNTSAGIHTYEIDKSVLPEGVTVDEANTAILTMPLGLMGQSNGAPVIWLAENINGYNLRADKFVFRMNPGTCAGAQQPNGDTAVATFYVTQFGNPAINTSLDAYVMSENESFQYTIQTLGTSGTQGIRNICTPQDAVLLTDPVTNSGKDPVTGATRITTNAKGVAELKISASNPGYPRADQSLDGQIYFIKYNFANLKVAEDFRQDDNDKISLLVFDQPDIPAKPTWDNCIKNILPQYGKLYPIMGRFGLNDYDCVVKYAEPIRVVLSKPIDDAMHMPVIRDMSILRTNAILQWIADGTPES
ncbi:MAG: hypothetical protein ACI9FJ_000155 [Alteromonadaceae bacterium]|jgi:hypothetical protein